MKTIKILAILITIVFSIEFVTYLIFSRHRINSLIYKNYETGMLDFPDSLPTKKSFYTDQELNEIEKKQWKQFFNDSELQIIVYEHSEIEKLKPKMNQFNYAVYADSEFAILEVSESMNVNEYVEVWRSRYMWLFVDWVKIEKVSIGQS